MSWLLLTAGWALPQSALCADGFLASAFPASGWGFLAYLAALVCLIVALLLTGFVVARRAGWPWLAAWTCAAAAAIALEVMTAQAESFPWAVASRWEWLALSGGFLAVGTAMAAILIRARRPARQSDPGSGGVARKPAVTWATAAVMAIAVVAAMTAGLARWSLPPGVDQVVPARLISAGAAGLRGSQDGVVAADGNRAWIVGDQRVSEFNAGTGRLLWVIPDLRLGIRDPGAAVVEGHDLWIASDPWTGTGSITELNANTGSLIRILTGVDDPADIAVDGRDLWIVNDLHDSTSVTELSASTGRLIRTLATGNPGTDDASEIAAAGNDIWIASGAGDGDGSITELHASTGRLIRVLSGRRYGLDCPNEPSDICPEAIAADGTHLWIANASDTGRVALAEFSAGTGRVVLTLPNGRCGLYPADLTVSRGRVWVANVNPDENGGSVTELNTATGRCVRTILDGSWSEERVAGGPSMIAVAKTHIWIENYGPWDEAEWGPVAILTRG